MSKLMERLVKGLFGEPSPYEALNIVQDIRRDQEKQERRSWAAIERGNKRTSQMYKKTTDPRAKGSR